MLNESDAILRQNAQERAVGISVFVKPEVPGFQCVVKQRYTDFLVNEVLPNGEVLHLTEVSHDQNRKRKREPEDESQKKKQKENGHSDANPEANGEQKEPNGNGADADGLKNGSKRLVLEVRQLETGHAGNCEKLGACDRSSARPEVGKLRSKHAAENLPIIDAVGTSRKIQ